MRSGIKQLATCLLVLLGAGAAHAINPGIYKAIDENDSVRLAGLLDKEMPVGRLAANVLNYAALTGDDKGVQVLLDNIHLWNQAPVWDTALVAEATRDWFKYLGDGEGS